MALQAFTVSEPLTLGVELELQLVSTHDFDLAPQAEDLLRVLKNHTGSWDVKPEITRSMIAKPTVMNNLLAGKRTLWSQNPSRRYSQELLALNQVMADSVFDEQENPTRQETKTLPPLKRPVNVLEAQPKKDNDWTPLALSPQTKRSMQNDVADSMLLVTQVNDLAIIEQDELIYHNDTLNSHRLIDNPSMMVTSLDKQRISQRLIDESPVKHPPGAEQIEN